METPWGPSCLAIQQPIPLQHGCSSLSHVYGVLRQVYAKIRKHRESLNLSTVALEERQVYRDDFLLVVFDYYLAMGPEHMRKVFIDLLRT